MPRHSTTTRPCRVQSAQRGLVRRVRRAHDARHGNPLRAPRTARPPGAQQRRRACGDGGSEVPASAARVSRDRCRGSSSIARAAVNAGDGARRRTVAGACSGHGPHLCRLNTRTRDHRKLRARVSTPHEQAGGGAGRRWVPKVAARGLRRKRRQRSMPATPHTHPHRTHRGTGVLPHVLSHAD